MTPPDHSQPVQVTFWHIEERFEQFDRPRYLTHADNWSSDYRDRIAFMETSALQNALDRIRGYNPDGDFHAVSFTATLFGPLDGDLAYVPEIDMIPQLTETIIEPNNLDAAALSYVREKLDAALQAFRTRPLTESLVPGKIQSMHAQQLETIIALRHACVVLSRRAQTQYASLPWQHPDTKEILTGRARRFLAIQPEFLGAIEHMLFYRDPLHPDRQPLWAIMPTGALCQTSTTVMPGDPETARLVTRSERPI